MNMKGLYYRLVMSQEDNEDLLVSPDELLEEEMMTSSYSSLLQDNVDSVQDGSLPHSRVRLISESSLQETKGFQGEQQVIRYFVIHKRTCRSQLFLSAGGQD